MSQFLRGEWNLKLTIDSASYAALRHHAEEAYPNECCGVLTGHFEGDGNKATVAISCANTRQDSPRNRYRIAPIDLVRIQRQAREEGRDIIGFYHSHPDHPAQWSTTDLTEAHWLDCSYVITGVIAGQAAETRSFRLVGIAEQGTAEQDPMGAGPTNEKQFVEESLEIR